MVTTTDRHKKRLGGKAVDDGESLLYHPGMMLGAWVYCIYTKHL